MPKLLFARPPVDAVEERKIRKLAGARHAPADWIRRARIIALSWDGMRVPAIAAAVGCSQKAVRERLARFAADGLDGLGDRPGAGRKPRISQAQRPRLIALARSTPPGGWSATTPASWTPPTPPARRCGPWTRSPPRPVRPASPSPAPRCAGSCWPRECAGVGPTRDHQRRSGVRPKRTRVVELYTHPPAHTTVIAADELGPVMPRAFDPPAGWSPDGHRPKVPLTYSRGPDKTWIYGGLLIGDGQAVTLCAPSRNSAHWQEFLTRLEQANPTGTIAVITDNLSSHHSLTTRAWLAGHPRIEQVFIQKGTCWLNLQEAWWRIFRRHALAGQTFADPAEIAQATELTTAQLNAHAKPWIWGRPPSPPRPRRRRFTYLL
jgi:transposase